MGNPPEVTTSGDVTYACPEGWSITDELDYGGIGYYSACEKDGENSSGVFVLSWFGIEQELNESLGDMQDNLEQGYEAEGLDIDISKPEEAVFNGYDALISDYGFSMEGIRHQGKIIAFSCQGKGVVILSQEAAKDHDEYLADFEGIGNSIECGAS